jgi:hypothetical protein
LKATFSVGDFDYLGPKCYGNKFKNLAIGQLIGIGCASFDYAAHFVLRSAQMTQFGVAHRGFRWAHCVYTVDFLAGVGKRRTGELGQWF